MDAGAEDTGGVGIRRQTVVETSSRARVRSHLNVVPDHGITFSPVTGSTCVPSQPNPCWDGSVFAYTRRGLTTVGKVYPASNSESGTLSQPSMSGLAPQPGQSNAHWMALSSTVRPKMGSTGLWGKQLSTSQALFTGSSAAAIIAS